jgi:hypothetical protein
VSGFAYIESSIAPGVTIDEFRRSRPAVPHGWRRVVRWLMAYGRDTE